MSEQNFEIIKSVFISVVAAAVIWVANSIGNDMRRMSESVGVLNSQIAVLVERVAIHNKAFDEHEKRIRELERNEIRR